MSNNLRFLLGVILTDWREEIFPELTLHEFLERLNRCCYNNHGYWYQSEVVKAYESGLRKVPVSYIVDLSYCFLLPKELIDDWLWAMTREYVTTVIENMKTPNETFVSENEEKLYLQQLQDTYAQLKQVFGREKARLES